MPAVLSTIPDNFQFVMRRYDRNHRLAFRFVCYGENTTSRSINLDGIIAPTLFLNTQPARDRAKKMGWEDETTVFREMQKPPTGISTPDKKTPRRRKQGKRGK
jgi:hypothetical protein